MEKICFWLVLASFAIMDVMLLTNDVLAGPTKYGY